MPRQTQAENRQMGDLWAEGGVVPKPIQKWFRHKDDGGGRDSLGNLPEDSVGTWLRYDGTALEPLGNKNHSHTHDQIVSWRTRRVYRIACSHTGATRPISTDCG
eukprot:TRINITY_DN2912_c1_g1_i1.p1 TRINITY_DN2912_c1_g1~~TRINITY_DN2912_c1_g1_i1.p1  ORF type:complete len:104 (-),score=2.85 TRINITY_DN2912_c1_g1_i1:85-396(-)